MSPLARIRSIYAPYFGLPRQLFTLTRQLLTKVVVQEGDMFDFKTLSTFRNYELAFTGGVEFEEYTKGLDKRNVKFGDKLLCVQKGEKVNSGWKHWTVFI
ncbi:retinol-binding protein 2-like [Phyllopteryx taeniolatus]|uniref:retinol-binding protein 2-like n=1 Tax=Phyllopteryx taeniolatus TaxID=161469 RepID=UPI002AD31692|nr:retinol-binding protein 2-like [Phyllopteryx taeniolatus]